MQMTNEEMKTTIRNAQPGDTLRIVFNRDLFARAYHSESIGILKAIGAFMAEGHRGVYVREDLKSADRWGYNAYYITILEGCDLNWLSEFMMNLGKYESITPVVYLLGKYVVDQYVFIFYRTVGEREKHADEWSRRFSSARSCYITERAEMTLDDAIAVFERNHDTNDPRDLFSQPSTSR